MKPRLSSTIAAAKLTRSLARLRRHGGSALPGLVAEKLMPDFLPQALASLPDGVVIVTGTNGKTTTTKMIADSLTALGKRVLTNKTGSNFTRGIAATIVQEAKLGIRLPHDIAVIELDEAYAKKFVALVRPRYVVALNVIRDQLDRFGEVDSTAKLIASVMQAATIGCVVNGDDPRLVRASQQLEVPVSFYSVAPALRANFPTDEELYSHGEAVAEPAVVPEAAVQLTGMAKNQASYKIAGKHYTTDLAVTGQYNYQNAAAAIALLKAVCPLKEPAELLAALATVTPAFGRGDTLTVDGQPVEVLLVKNPAGFRQSLLSFTSPAATMIAINDNDADGRDVSWLWDVDFSHLPGVRLVSGIRAYDMALRLQYDGVAYVGVEPDLAIGLKQFMKTAGPKRIFCTYTAMLPLHAALSRLAGQERSL